MGYGMRVYTVDNDRIVEWTSDSDDGYLVSDDGKRVLRSQLRESARLTPEDAWDSAVSEARQLVKTADRILKRRKDALSRLVKASPHVVMCDDCGESESIIGTRCVGCHSVSQFLKASDEADDEERVKTLKVMKGWRSTPPKSLPVLVPLECGECSSLKDELAEDLRNARRKIKVLQMALYGIQSTTNKGSS